MSESVVWKPGFIVWERWRHAGDGRTKWHRMMPSGGTKCGGRGRKGGRFRHDVERYVSDSLDPSGDKCTYCELLP